LIVEQTEAIVSDAGKDVVAKEKAVARNVKCTIVNSLDTICCVILTETNVYAY